MAQEEKPIQQIGPWTRLRVQSVYRNPWIHVEHHDVLRPDGSPGIYGVVHFAHCALGVVVLDHEGFTWLVGQHRYPLDRYSWEIPEGGGSAGEDPLIGIQRELREETGLTADEWIPLGEFHTSNSVCNESGFVFLARSVHLGEAQPEPDEQISVRRLPFAEALAMASDGRITDCISVLALFRAREYLRKEGQLPLDVV